MLEIDAFCKQHGIDAQLSLNGVYYTATNRAQAGGMQPVVDELQRLEVNSWRRCSVEELLANAGSPRHIEGYHSPVAANVQPALLARGLRRVAIDLGVEVYENTPMTDRKSTRLNSSHTMQSRMPSSA